MKRVLLSGIALVSLFTAGLPGPSFAQVSGSPTAQYDNLVNKDDLLVTMEESSGSALLGGESVFKGKLKNQGSAPLYNVGWTVELPSGVNYKSVKAGPGDFGTPKVTVLLYNDGRTTTVLHWNNVADLSPGAEAWFEIGVDNNAPEKGTQPPAKGTYFAPGDTFEAKVWASGSTNEMTLPAFQEYGLASFNEGAAKHNRSWATDRQQVKVEGMITTLAMSDIVNGVVLRGNKEGHRQVATVTIDKTKFGDIALSKPVTISLDPAWEVMGTCAKSVNCFIPAENQLRWVGGANPHWELDIPANKFDFGTGQQAKVQFEIAALDKKNVDPQNRKKVNPAGLGGDGDDAGGNPDDIARFGVGAPAYANNTGTTTQNIATIFTGNGEAKYTHPWNQHDTTKYKNQNNVGVQLPPVQARIEDATIVLTTVMDDGGNYKNDGPVTKKLVIKTNEYTRLPNDHSVVVTLPPQECFVNKPDLTCITNGPITFNRVTNTGAPVAVTGVVSTNPQGIATLTIPSDQIPDSTSATHEFTFGSKVLGAGASTEVVNGKPLKTTADFSWQYSGRDRSTVDSNGELPTTMIDVLSTVAFPLNGACPAPLTGIPAGKKIEEDPIKSRRSSTELNGQPDTWGKLRKVSAGDELCFQVNLAFPDGIKTKSPELRIYLPSQGDLVGSPHVEGSGGLTFAGSLAGAKQVVLDPANEDAATKSVAKPELRKPIAFTMGNMVDGGSTLSVVYKVSIKNGAVLDPMDPPVLWDNLAKLSYKDHAGEFFNARDTASYDFTGPALMLAVDKPTATINRGATTKLTYTVTNVGGGGALAGAKVALRLPESVSCANVVVGGAATKETCVDTGAPGRSDKLLSGNYLLVTLNDALAPSNPQATTDETKFTVDITTSNEHMPSTSYKVDAGIVSFAKQEVNSPKNIVYLPRANAFCKDYGQGLQGQQLEDKDKECALAVANDLFQVGGVPITNDKLGKDFIVVNNTAAKGALKTTASSLLTTGDPSLSSYHLSSDANQDPTGPNGRKRNTWLVPGERGGIKITIGPPLSATPAAPAPATLKGSQHQGHTSLEFVLLGMDMANHTLDGHRFLTQVSTIKNSLKTAFGANINENQIIVTTNPGTNTYTVKAPLKGLPGAPVDVLLNDLFIAPDPANTGAKQVAITTLLKFKPVTLVHPDEAGAPRIDAAPISGVAEKVVPGRANFESKTPVLTATKSVLNRPDLRISGGQDVDYEITLHNTGEVPVYDVAVTDTLPEGLTHQANVTVHEVSPGVAGITPGPSPWELTDGAKVGKWKHDMPIMIPAGGRIVLRYQAHVANVVTVDHAYRNEVRVPYSSQAGTGLGVVTKTITATADVRGLSIDAQTTITPQTQRHPNNAVQHGETVTTRTTIRIPARTRVPNLSLLTELSGATVDRAHAQVRVTCPAAITNCQQQPPLMAGAPNKLGVVITDQPFENNTNAAVDVVIETSGIVVTDGAGPVVATGNAYRGATVPTSLDTFLASDEVSTGNSGSVPVLTPALSIESTLLRDHTDHQAGTPVTTPVEPGTEGLVAKITLTNTTDGSVLRNVEAEIKTKLEAIGLTPAASYTNGNWNNGTISIPNLQGGPGNAVTLHIPVEWVPAVFQGPNPSADAKTATLAGRGETGPINANIGAVAPETPGKPISTTSGLTFTPVYPQPSLQVRVTTLDGQVVTQNPPVMNPGDKLKVTFTPSIGGGTGYNPLMCIKPEEVGGITGAPLSIKDLVLDNPPTGMAIVANSPNCAAGEAEITLPYPTPGAALPPVTFIVEPSGTAISFIADSKINASFKVDSQIEGKHGPGPRSFAVTAAQPLQVSPGVDIRIQTTWLQPNGQPFTGAAVYDDFVTETTPVKAKITIANIGQDVATSGQSISLFTVPTGWTVEMPADPMGWACTVRTAGTPHVLECTRTTNLPARQTTPFEVTLVSPSGSGIRLPQTPLIIRGAHGDNRGAASPFDHNKANDQVDTQASVLVPNPDLSPHVTVTDTLRKPGSDTKPFKVEVTHGSDALRGNEIKVVIGTINGSGPITITQPGGWVCTPIGTNTTCVWPNASAGQGVTLPPIAGTVNLDGLADNAELQATTGFQRSAPGGTVVTIPDANPANDGHQATFVPFTGWVDGGITVTFTNPNPAPGVDPEPKIQITNNGGGGSLTGNTTLTIEVPHGANVADGGGVSACTRISEGDENTPDTWSCQITGNPTPGNPIDGPTITGIDGPNKTVSARITVGGVQDPSLVNNQASARTRSNQSSPGNPVPLPKPTPSDPITPDPSNRPITIPPAPQPPATPVPAQPGYTPVDESPESRANSWVDAVISSDEKARIVLIGRNNVFADSLSSGGLQGILDAPLLLNPVDHVSDATKETLDRLNPEQVILLGGPVAQSPAVEAELKAMGWNVSRIQGPTRVETAIEAATLHAPEATHGVLARAYASNWGSGSQAFADTLSGGAFAARQERPVLLTPTGTLADSLRTYLRNAKITHLTLLGSTEAISAEVEADLKAMGITTERISGANRAQTAPKRQSMWPRAWATGMRVKPNPYWWSMVNTRMRGLMPSPPPCTPSVLNCRWY